MLPAGLLPQEADRRCDLVGVDGVSAAGAGSLEGGDVSTSRQDTEGDLMCCTRNQNKVRERHKHFPAHTPVVSQLPKKNHVKISHKH